MREIEGRDPEARKRKKLEGRFGLEGYEAPDEIWYAKARQIEGGEMVLEGDEDGQPYSTENGQGKGQQMRADNGGILTDSTLAAIQSYSTQFSGKGIQVAALCELLSWSFWWEWCWWDLFRK